MTMVMAILIAVLVLAILLYLGRGYWAWVGALLVLIAGGHFSGASPVLTGLALILTGSLSLVFGMHSLRRGLLTKALMKIVRRNLPVISETEQTALDAGTVWWDAELFTGRPDWKRLSEFNVTGLTAEEQAFLDGPVEEICRKTNDWQVAQDRDLSPELWQELKDQKFFGMIIPKEYGGLGFSAQAHSAVVLKLSSRSLPLSVIVMVPNSLGPAELLLHYGTDQQKKYYLPRLARGEEMPCFALTEPKAGSDAASIQSNGVLCKEKFEGKEVLGIRLNWRKRYITLAPVATVVGLAFQLHDPDGLLGDEKNLGITCALIPRETKGMVIGKRHDPMGVPFPNGPIEGKDVFIPLDWVIGGEKGVGQGWRMLMESLAAGRSVSLPSLSLGAAQLSTRVSGAYATVRRQFGTPIGKFEGVAERLARIGGLTYGMDAARRLTCAAVDAGERPSVLSGIAKAYLTENMRTIFLDAMDILGGAAICRGPRNLLSRAYDGIPIAITVEGANILTRSMIIFGQGSIRGHPFVPQELQSVAKNDLNAFDEAFWGHINFTASNAVRAGLDGLTDGRFIKVTGPTASRRHKQRLTRYCSAFVLLADVSMLVLGSSLKRRETLSGRLADALSWLYLATAAIKRFEDEGAQDDDRIYLDWFCAYAFQQIEQALITITHNYPVKYLGTMLRLRAFFLGRTAHGPKDAQNLELSRRVMGEKGGRDRLAADLAVSKDSDEALGALEQAYAKVLEVAVLDDRIREARKAGKLKGIPREELHEAAAKEGIITAEEFKELQVAEALADAVIEVDSFTPAAYKKLKG
ncbi:acyl-CoA dehydrogenase [Kiloniella laminariae]|uniref:acyl-CoA dehydrogenase n=1 Tax=Kiloniella laminariae TaxID=454162 RepID=UPI001B7FC41D|nr:acyl-CoA dehydrogenase [Kiloniella laminariae]